VQVQVLFPALLQHKDLRRRTVGPFSFLAPESVANRWQQGCCVALTWHLASCRTSPRWIVSQKCLRLASTESSKHAQQLHRHSLPGSASRPSPRILLNTASNSSLQPPIVFRFLAHFLPSKVRCLLYSIVGSCWIAEVGSRPSVPVSDLSGLMCSSSLFQIASRLLCLRLISCNANALLLPCKSPVLSYAVQATKEFHFKSS